MTAGLFLLVPMLWMFPVKAQDTVIGTAQGNLTAQGAGIIPHLTIGGEEAYSMFLHGKLPDETAFLLDEGYEDAGVQALLDAGYPFDGLGLQKKYGVSDDFARVVTQQALWFYIAGWPFESTEDSIRARYIRELMQIAEEQKPRERTVSVAPEKPSFQRKNGHYRSEVMTLSKADGVIAVQPESGVQIVSENGEAVTTLRQGDRFILLAQESLTVMTVHVEHRFSSVVPLHYIPAKEEARMDHLLRGEMQEQTRGGVWRYALPEAEQTSRRAPSAQTTLAPASSAPAATTAPAETMPQTGSPSTGGIGAPATAATLLGLCWVTAGIAFLGKKSRNSRK